MNDGDVGTKPSRCRSKWQEKDITITIKGTNDALT